MSGTIHRFMTRLFHGQHATYPPVGAPQRRGIPDDLLDKLPPLAERPCDRRYVRDLVSRHFVETPDPQISGPVSGSH